MGLGLGLGGWGRGWGEGWGQGSVEGGVSRARLRMAALLTTYYLRMAALLTIYYLLPAYGRSTYYLLLTTCVWPLRCEALGEQHTVRVDVHLVSKGKGLVGK